MTTRMAFKFEGLNKAYEKEANKLMEEVRTKYVIPFCDRTGCVFNSGMGTWTFYKDKKNGERVHLDSLDLPRRLVTMLTIQHGLYQQDIGSVMKPYTPKAKS